MLSQAGNMSGWVTCSTIVDGVKVLWDILLSFRVHSDFCEGCLGAAD